MEEYTLDKLVNGKTLREIIPTLPFTFQFNRNLKPADWKDMDQVLQLHQLLKDLFQWSMDNKRFNLASHWAEIGASFQKICLKEIDFRDIVVINKGWNPTRKFRLLEVIVARNYLDNHFPKWENKLLPTKAKNFKSASGNMASIGTIIKEIIMPHRKGNIRLNPEFVVLDDAHIQSFLLGTDYHRMYGIDIYNSKKRHITIGTNKEKTFSLDIYQISAQDPIKELLNEFREEQFSTTFTSKQKLSLLKILRKNRTAFAIGEYPLGKIRGHDLELYMAAERPYPPMLRRPPYPAIPETRKEIEKLINELLEMYFIRKIGHNEIVEITTPVLITWNYGKYRLFGDFRALNNYTKADRYPIHRIPHALDKLAKAR
ncbi:hypothetical protein O181_054696 [Austropuccinia psidii MF-1]|uniref:Uncharacterized protein n=1 Tax=Austropuccinia psidii MF-1 TaxID=1389203 RepID=A0A9Q3E306_9BASI|nr:hypothetical protein [Austropuccinia psidii MF-1]